MGRPPLPPPPLLDPAWYPDPTGRYEARYWDGRKWTSHISHYGATGADPLLRARWDRWWIRGTFRVLLWASFIAVGYWAVTEYWPSSERDLQADEDLAAASVLLVGDMPTPGWSNAAVPLASPLRLEVDEAGEVPVPACVTLSESVADGADEPRRSGSFTSPDGFTTVGYAVTVGDGSGFAKRYLDAIGSPEGGACLSTLWGESTEGVSAVAAQAMTASFGDDTVWWRLTTVDESGAFAVESVADVVVVRLDNVVSEFMFVGEVDAVGVDVQRDLIQIELGRIRDLVAARQAAEADATPTPDATVDGEGPDEGGTDPEGTEPDGG